MKKNSLPITDKTLNDILSFLDEQDNFVFFDTNRFDSVNTHSYLFSNFAHRLVLKNGESIDSFFRQAEEYLNKGFHLAGWMAYELGAHLEPSLTSLSKSKEERILADFGVFNAPHIFDHSTGLFTTDFSARQLPPFEKSFSIDNLQINQTKSDYLEKIKQIKYYIESGDTYQVNYTMKLHFDFGGDPSALYKTLRKNQSVSYGAYAKLGSQIVQSFSPELFFKKIGNTCIVRPMKGTGGRGKTFADDLSEARILQGDDKNRSENVMIVDLLRNDLGRICNLGQVEVKSLFDIETYQTLHQMTSTVSGSLRQGIGLQELFKAIFPCGSVTGAPKIRTMEIIDELESKPRGVYTGAIGFISPARDMTFNVPIRTIVIDKDKGEMGIGSGIVHDSKPLKEWQECLLKGRFLTDPAPNFQLIETILWQPGHGFFLLEHHLQRIAESAAYFNFSLEGSSLAEKLEKAALGWKTTTTSLRVRILLHRDGNISITATACEDPENLTIPIPASSDALPKVLLAENKSDSNSPYTYHKTTMRQCYDSQLKVAKEDGFSEVFFSNEKGEVTEGAISNIIIKSNNTYYTPPITCGLLPGTMRGYLLGKYPHLLKEKTLLSEDLRQAKHIYMLNSVRGIVEVRLHYEG